MVNPNIPALIVSEILAFIRTDGQTDMARSIRVWSWSKLYIFYGVGKASYYLLCTFRRIL